MIPAVAMTAAGMSFFFHVHDFAAGRDFAIAPDDASAAQSSEAEKPNETHLTPPERSLSNSHAADLARGVRYGPRAASNFTYRLY
jgi:hypothetical protein